MLQQFQQAIVGSVRCRVCGKTAMSHLTKWDPTWGRYVSACPDQFKRVPSERSRERLLFIRRRYNPDRCK